MENTKKEECPFMYDQGVFPKQCDENCKLYVIEQGDNEGTCVFVSMAGSLINLVKIMKAIGR